MGSLESDTTERLHFHFSLLCTGEGNGNPLQCSCLENPRDGRAWWAAIYGVTQSRTRLKWLSSTSHTYMFLSWLSPNQIPHEGAQKSRGSLPFQTHLSPTPYPKPILWPHNVVFSWPPEKSHGSFKSSSNVISSLKPSTMLPGRA